MQIVGALFVIGYNIFMTSLICVFIKYVCRVPLRMSEEHMEVGDDAVHGELAYAIFYDGQHSHVKGDLGRMPSEETGGMLSGTGVVMGRPVKREGGSDEESGSNGVEKVEGVKTD